MHVVQNLLAQISRSVVTHAYARRPLNIHACKMQLATRVNADAIDTLFSEESKRAPLKRVRTQIFAVTLARFVLGCSCLRILFALRRNNISAYLMQEVSVQGSWLVCSAQFLAALQMRTQVQACIWGTGR